MLLQLPGQQHALIPVLPVLLQECPAEHSVLPDHRRLLVDRQVRKQVIALPRVSHFHLMSLLRYFPGRHVPALHLHFHELTC